MFFEYSGTHELNDSFCYHFIPEFIKRNCSVSSRVICIEILHWCDLWLTGLYWLRVLSNKTIIMPPLANLLYSIMSPSLRISSVYSTVKNLENPKSKL